MSSIRLPLMLMAMAALSAVASAQKPGPVFPYFDNCRRTTDHQLRNVTALPRKVLEDGVSEYCFRVNLLKTKCTPEIFPFRTTDITSRCCDATFAKIKFYVNVDCKNQFMPSNLTVPLQPSMNKLVSPNWEYTKEAQLNYTSVKYTQFGPIQQKFVDGTTFCLRLKPPTGEPGSKCNTTTLAGVAHPIAKAKGIFQLAIYDRKADNYECCPTFSYKTTTTAPRKARMMRRRLRFAL